MLEERGTKRRDGNEGREAARVGTGEESARPGEKF